MLFTKVHDLSKLHDEILDLYFFIKDNAVKDKTKLLDTLQENIPEAAKILELSAVRVKQLAKGGKIGQMVAGRYLFVPAELRQFKRKTRPPGRPKTTGK